jgi:hypothetical protein
MVSTRRYDQAFRSAPSPDEQKCVLEDWNRTIAA